MTELLTAVTPTIFDVLDIFYGRKTTVCALTETRTHASHRECSGSTTCSMDPDSRGSSNDHTGFHAVCISTVLQRAFTCTTAQDRDRIEKLTSRLRRGGFLLPGPPSYKELAGKADVWVLKSITTIQAMP